jgi:hypothetical protein
MQESVELKPAHATGVFLGPRTRNLSLQKSFFQTTRHGGPKQLNSSFSMQESVEFDSTTCNSSSCGPTHAKFKPPKVIFQCWRKFLEETVNLKCRIHAGGQGSSSAPPPALQIVLVQHATADQIQVNK